MGLTITHRSRAGFSLLAETAGRFSRPVDATQDATAQIEDALRKLRPVIHKDSDELASTGLKKTSEYKKRGPKPGGAAAGTAAG